MADGEVRRPGVVITSERPEVRTVEPTVIATDPPDRPSPAARDHAIDRLRSLCLVSMAVGHLAVMGPTPSMIDRAVHLPMWVSGASGFVFLSGVSIGLVWTRQGGPTRAVRRWTASRGLFLLAIGLVLDLALAWSPLVRLPPTRAAVEPTLVEVLTGRWWLPFVDALGMYAVFLIGAALLAPLVFAHPQRVLAASAALYAASLALPEVGPIDAPGLPVRWDLPAWQIVFVAGLLAGTRWPQVRAWLADHHRAVAVSGALGLAAIVVLRTGFNIADRGFGLPGIGSSRSGIESFWLDKRTLGPGRLLLIAAVGPLAYRLCTHPLPADRLMIAAGSRSLRVYLVSTLVALLLVGWAASGQPGQLTWEALILGGTALSLAAGSLRSVGRGRWWSI